MRVTDDLTELLKRLCVIPAPSGSEDRRAEFCRDWLLDNGVQNVHIDAAKNVVISFGDCNASGITVFLAHTDVVFPDTDELPYSESDDKIFSPGVGDNTVHVAMLMRAARHIANAGLTPPHGVLLVLNSCEEGLGNLKGIKRIMQDYAGKIDAVISFDGSYSALVTKCVGSERHRVAVETEGGHSFGAFGNKNAIHILASVINTLYEKTVPQIGDSKTTYNVGTISGGTSVNTIAQHAEMLYEYRSDSEECLSHMREFFNSIIESYKAKGFAITVETVGIRPCGKGVDEKKLSALATRCAEICERESGIYPVFRSGSTDSNIPMSIGIPSVTVGGYLGGGAHTREEWVEKKSLPIGERIVKNTILSFFGEEHA